MDYRVKKIIFKQRMIEKLMYFLSLLQAVWRALSQGGNLERQCQWEKEEEKKATTMKYSFLSKIKIA